MFQEIAEIEKLKEMRTDRDAPVYICDNCFCSYNEKYNIIEIGRPSEELSAVYNIKGPIELTHDNAVRSMVKVEDSFWMFMSIRIRC